MTTRTANPSLRSSMRDAEMTLVRAIIDPTDRSIPRAITAMACATAANASGSTETASPCTPAAP